MYKRLSYQKTFEEIFTYDKLYRAYRKCILGVAWKTQVQGVKATAPVYIYDIYASLHNGKYRLSAYREFDIFEHGKPRHILSVFFKDRVVQRCLADNLIVPLLERSFIYESGACIKGKGIHFQRRLIKRHLVNFAKHCDIKNCYVLQYDFSKFFANLDHELIKRLIRKYFDDEKCLKMIDDFVDSFKGDRGLGLGSELSYLFALMIANELDHFIKEQLCCKWYGRYMDDGYLLCESKEQALEWMNAIADKCEELHITLNRNKTQITKLTHKFTFLKRMYSYTDTGRVIEIPVTKTFVKMRRKLKKLSKMLSKGVLTWDDIYISYTSWMSCLRGADCYFKLKSVQRVYTDIKRRWLYENQLERET